MALSNDLISEFVKLTNDKTETPKSTTVYGTVVESDGLKWVKLDGSPDGLLTPVETTTEVSQDDRVIVDIKDHTAVVTGNLTQPSASTKTTEKIGTKISEFEIITAYKVNADDVKAINGYFENLKSIVGSFENITTEDLETINASIVYLEAKYADIDNLTADDVKVLNAEIENLKATFASIETISTNELDAANATIDQLTAYNANFTYVHAEVLSALKANINTLTTDKLDANWANIDYAKIDKAVMEEFYAASGLIQYVTAEDATVTGHLVGVTISGDLIEGNTIKADKLLVKGEDGLYYKLNVEGGVTITESMTEEELDKLQNGLHGSIIVANTITADKINVSDLVAFGATIGGFIIKEGALYSGIKDSIHNTTQGIYLDKDGQANFGDDNNFIKYYKDEVYGGYRLDIAASRMLIGNDGNDLEELFNYIHIDPSNGSLTFGAGENAMSLSLENDLIVFKKNGNLFGWWDGVDFHTGNIRIDVTERAQFGNFAFVPRSDGSLSFLKVEHNEGFYTILTGHTLIMYGSYPVLEDTTLIINDVPGELDGTTLNLGGE